MEILYNDLEFLKTRAGLWNVLMFRGVFYGSEFAKNKLQHFQDLDDWRTFYEKEKSSGTEDDYFVNVRAYGPANRHRKIDLVESYWDACAGWPQQNLRTFESMATYLDTKKPGEKKMGKKKISEKLFRNIGPLTTMLICGDLALAGVLELPSVEELGRVISRLGLGAKRGLFQLGLISDLKTAREDEVVKAFKNLFSYLDMELTPAEKQDMSFSPLMLEHTLCKYGRFCKLAVG